MAYENNHYIPRFILRQFGEYLNVYNVKDGSLCIGERTDHIFAERKIYPSDLEKDIGYKLESPFAKLFHNKLMSGKPGDKIVLTRKEILLMKRFYLLETIRVTSMAEITKKEKALSGFYSSLFSDFNEKLIPDETTTDRWLRNIRVVIESEDLIQISKHPLCTYEVLKWSFILNSGYFAFWDCAGSGVDFLISDIGMTSEVEPSMLTDGYEHTKKDYLYKLFERETNIFKKDAYQRLLSAQSLFYENFYMYPLSKNRMIVTVNPFFSLYDRKTKLTKPIGIWPTQISDKRLLEKNESPKLVTIMGKPLCKDDDEFSYTIQRVKPEDAEYINMLMLNRIDTYMGYSDWKHIESSVKRYIDFHNKIKMKPPIDYKSLTEKAR
ncbi:MAG: DUF4238 domain-containing protein [Oscillospiraceae bacterium]|nr:DUF4238 domain-containing protein [Oscillospiraceae bacterium]